jgi:hypothetical protein
MRDLFTAPWSSSPECRCSFPRILKMNKPSESMGDRWYKSLKTSVVVAIALGGTDRAGLSARRPRTYLLMTKLNYPPLSALVGFATQKHPYGDGGGDGHVGSISSNSSDHARWYGAARPAFGTGAVQSHVRGSLSFFRASKDSIARRCFAASAPVLSWELGSEDHRLSAQHRCVDHI